MQISVQLYQKKNKRKKKVEGRGKTAETNTHGQSEKRKPTHKACFWVLFSLQLLQQQKMAKQQRKTFENSAKKWKKIKWQSSLGEGVLENVGRYVSAI